MYEVQEIVNFRFNSKANQHEYLVKWVGYDHSEDTWEPQKHLAHCQDLIKQYHKKKEKIPLRQLSKEKSQENSFEEELFNDDKKLENLKKKLKNRLAQDQDNVVVKREHQNEKQPLKVLKVGEKKNKKKFYQIRIGEKVKWVERQFLIPKYAVQYCEFLEQHAHYSSKN